MADTISTPLTRNISRWAFILTFALAIGTLASGSAIATHMPGHTTGGGQGNNPPVIDDQNFSLAENELPGSSVGVVVATSTKKNNTLEYEIIAGNDTGLFLLDQFTGALTAAASLDHEASSSHILSVEVVDKFGRSSIGLVTVDVGDVNEAPVADNANFAVLENLVGGAVVGTAPANDVDAPLEPFGTLSYAIVSGNAGGEFSINVLTGQISTTIALNHETVPQFNLIVEVTDGGVPSLSDMANITVTVQNVNEAPVATDTIFNVSEQLPVGAAVGSVPASDPDNAAPFNTLSYAITAGNDDNAFDIDPSTGELFTLDALNFDLTPFYNLAVTVTDLDGQPDGLSDTASVTINVADAVVPTNVADIDGTNGFAVIETTLERL